MRTVRSLDPSVSLKDRVSFRLMLLFVATFMAVLIAMVAWSLLSLVGDRAVANAESEVQTPAIVIDPKIESDLAKAMTFDAIPASTDVRNPFIDRNNIGSNLTMTPAQATTQSVKPAATTGPSNAFGSLSSRQPNVTQVPGNSLMGPVDMGTKARHDVWQARADRGDVVEPESEVLGVEDLVPVGFASGGDRQPEVMLFSISLCKTFSFPAGTHFYNGWLNGFDQNEVVFNFDNGIRRKSYAGNIPCGTNSPGSDSTGNN